jgi:hypothetical protein
MANVLPVSSVVSVTVDMAPRAAQLRNFGAALIIGATDVIDVSERIRTYSAAEIDTIATDFGTTSPEYLAAQAFFSQSPQPSDVQIGRWAKTATNGLIRGRILSTSEQDISKFQSIDSGAFDVTIDGSVVNVSGVVLTEASNLNAVASAVTEKLNSKGTCLWDGQRFVIKSATTGTTSTVSTVTNTGLSVVMGLEAGTTMVNGAQAETLIEAITAMLDRPSWYMCFVAADYETEDAVAAAGLIEAASPTRVIAFTSMDTNELDAQKTDTLGAKLKALVYNHSLVMYSSTNAQAAASVLGRMSTVDFQGSSTTITLKFKQCPGVVAENLTTQQANALRDKNVNVFAAYDNDTSILQEGIMSGGWFIDERHGLDWLQNQVQTDIWNLLYTSTTKVGQDEAGATTLVSTCNRSLDRAVTNGLVAPGVWNGSPIGSLQTGDTLSTGYYVYIQPMDEQAQSDREARKAPPIQIAVKLRGAIHFVDVAITVNR